MAELSERAAESAGDAVAAVVDGAVAQIEAGAEAVLARAEAAEAALETMQDAALRDTLHDEIDDVQEGLEQWQQEHGAVHTSLENRLAAMEERMNNLQSQLTEVAAKPVATVITASTPQSSEPGETPQPAVTVTTVEPTAQVAAPAAPEGPVANRPRWI